MPRTRSVLLVVLVAAVPVLSPARPTITSVKPTGGSLNGGTRVHIQVCVCVCFARAPRPPAQHFHAQTCMHECMHASYIHTIIHEHLPAFKHKHARTHTLMHICIRDYPRARASRPTREGPATSSRLATTSAIPSHCTARRSKLPARHARRS